jgi:hypothetical protein
MESPIPTPDIELLVFDFPECEDSASTASPTPSESRKRHAEDTESTADSTAESNSSDSGLEGAKRPRVSPEALVAEKEKTVASKHAAMTEAHSKMTSAKHAAKEALLVVQSSPTNVKAEKTYKTAMAAAEKAAIAYKRAMDVHAKAKESLKKTEEALEKSKLREEAKSQKQARKEEEKTRKEGERAKEKEEKLLSAEFDKACMRIMATQECIRKTSPGPPLSSTPCLLCGHSSLTAIHLDNGFAIHARCAGMAHPTILNLIRPIIGSEYLAEVEQAGIECVKKRCEEITAAKEEAAKAAEDALALTVAK